MKLRCGRILAINPDKPERDRIEKAALTINKGGIVIFPTDTVYGIGAALSHPASIRKIYAIKKRSGKKPLVYLVGCKRDIAKFVKKIPAGAEKFIGRFWPGPLTIIFGIDGTGGKTIGLRMPDDRIALALLGRCGPLAATSANISGKKSAAELNDVEDSIKRKADLIIDGGRTKGGKESTVLDVSRSPFRIIREGSITQKDLSLE